MAIPFLLVLIGTLVVLLMMWWLCPWQCLAALPPLCWFYARRYRRRLRAYCQILPGGALVTRPHRLDEAHVTTQVTAVHLPTPTSLHTALQHATRLVLLGPQGSGKTTALHELITQADEQQLVILIPLHEIGDFLPQLSKLEELLPTYLARFGFPYSEPFVRRKLANGRLLLLLDGLDSLPHAAQRRRLLTLIDAFSWQYAATHTASTGNTIILTSRTHSYLQGQQLASFDRFALCAWEGRQVTRFVQQRLTMPAAELAGCFAFLSEHGRHHPLTQNPLLLLCLIDQFEQNPALRQLGAAQLCQCVQTMVGGWNRVRGVHNGRFTIDQKMNLLQQMALRQLEEGSLHSDQLEPPDGLLEEIIVSTSIIGDSGAKGLTFQFPVLQNWLAAEAIAKMGELKVARLSSHLHKSGWREVVQLLVEDTAVADPLIQQLLADSTPSEASVQRLLLAAECMTMARGVSHTTRLRLTKLLINLLSPASPAKLPQPIRKKVLTQLGHFAVDLLPPFVDELLANGGEEELFLAVKLVAYGRFSPIPPPLLTALAHLTTSPDDSTRHKAFEALKRLCGTT